MSDYYEKTRCRLCGGAIKGPVFDVGMVPISNSLSTDPSQEDPTYPLQLMQCEDCGHVQTSIVVREDLLFPKDYPYRSGTNPIMRKHLHDYALEIAAEVSGRRVLEIGSNDGTLLHELRLQGFNPIGVDPAYEVASKALGPTLPVAFSSMLAQHLRKVDCVVANHCLAHIDDLQDVIEGVRRVLKDDGIFVMEVGYFPDVLERGIFDVVYHEHLSQHHLRPLVPFLAGHDLHVYDAYRVDSQGGSVRVWASPKRRPLTPRLESLLEAEVDVNPIRLGGAVDEMKALLSGVMGERATAAAFGACAKLTTFCAATGFSPTKVYDDVPSKIGKYTPGQHAPIVSSVKLVIDAPDVLLLTSYNFAAEIVPRIRKQGYNGRVIVPRPTFEVLDVS